jgi:hypothetical protein
MSPMTGRELGGASSRQPVASSSAAIVKAHRNRFGWAEKTDGMGTWNGSVVAGERLEP